MRALPFDGPVDAVESHAKSDESPRYLPMLALWTLITVVTLGGLWIAGFRTRGLVGAVDKGAARIEAIRIGDIDDDLIRKTIQTQRETIPFWTVIALLGDFLVEPMALVARALAAATGFAAIAALRGRHIGFERALAECSAAQGFWVLGIVVRGALMMALRRDDIETSAALFLTPGTYRALIAIAVRQLDAFALIGWTTMAVGAVKRGQVKWPGALSVVVTLALIEAATRISFEALLGASMRLSVMPT